MTVLQKKKRLNPSQVLLLGFVVIILIGTFLLMLPVASATGQSVGFLDALFMATSAACVTGLAVVDIGSTFSRFGQVVILTLIQIGGLGFMTFAVLIFLILGRKISFQQRLYIQQSFNQQVVEGAVRLALSVFLIAFTLEGIGTGVLFLRWYPEMGQEALFFAIFHAVSAFNNAGMSLWSDSLMQFVGDPVVNLTFSGLVVLGGLGFTVIVDIGQHRRWKKLSLHSKLVLLTTTGLLLIGAVLIFLIEWFNPQTFKDLTLSERIWGAYFQSVTARTAGFNTLDIAAMLPTSQFLLMLLMFVGASPGSTGGGIKTTTFALLYVTIYSVVRGRREVSVMQRRISQGQIFRALALVMLAMTMVFMVSMVLSFTERDRAESFLEVMFEAISAFSTCGLSMGLTPELSPIGKAIITLTMLAGRVGPLTVAYALAQMQRKESYRYPEERVLIG